MQEEWKDVVGFEGLYAVSNLGRVKRLARISTNVNGRQTPLAEAYMGVDKLGKTHLWKDQQYYHLFVRSLVAEAFLGLPYGEPVTHLNGNTLDACLENIVPTEQFRTMNPDWRDIPGWEGYYQASRFGEIRSLDRYVEARGGLKFCEGVVKTPDKDDSGYLQIALYRGKEGHQTRHIHQYVAQAFIPNPENKPTVNHINGIKTDNRVENLEWATYSEQQYHAIHTGLRERSYWNTEEKGVFGEEWNKKQRVPVRCIETGEVFPSYKAAADAVGAKASADILGAINRKATCHGVHFVRACDPDYEIGVPNLKGEEWKDVPEFEGCYQFSNKGRVKSLYRKAEYPDGRIRSVPEKLITIDSSGKVSLRKDGRNILISIREIESMTFPETHKSPFKID